MKFLLDTNVISEVGKKQPERKVLNWLEQHGAASAVPSIAVAERYQGAYGHADPARRKRLIEDVAFLVEDYADRIIPFDSSAAEAWGKYVNSAAVLKTPPPYPDTQIAAIALSHDLVVVTRDTDHFPDVKTINPWA